jgi:hypothetical protein
MVEIFGKAYYLDIDGIVDKCRIEKKIIESDGEEDEEPTLVDDESQTINIFKYEIIKMCIDRVLGEIDEVDENMGPFASDSTTTSFKIAFNTLIKNEILIEDE